jgi:hypothetical protein
MVLGHLLYSVQPQSFSEWTRVSLEQSLAEFYTILLKEPLQVALRDDGGGNLFPLLSRKLTIVVSNGQGGC